MKLLIPAKKMIQCLICSVALLLGTSAAMAQEEPPRLLPHKDSILLTVVLKHVQTKNIRQIREERKENGFDKFPPKGVEVVADYRVLNLGRMMILRVPAELLRITTIAIEEQAWGPYETDLYLTYDLIEAREAHEKAKAAMKN